MAELKACLTQGHAFLPAFDKDDDLAMRFVTATANLRAHVFGIEPLQSLYSAKGIAGNIIPAIATTNAMAAGLQILQAIRLLESDDLSQCSYINCLRQPTRNGLLLTAAQLEPPNPQCFVCSNATVTLRLHIPNWTLQDLIDRVFKHELGFHEPMLSLEGDIFWEEGADADTETFQVNGTKPLSALPHGGIVDGAVVQVEDFSQDLSVDVVVQHQETWGDLAEEDEPDPLKYVLGGAKPQASRSEPEAAKVDDDDDDEPIVVLGDRKRPADDTNEERPTKRTKTTDHTAVIALD